MRFGWRPALKRGASAVRRLKEPVSAVHSDERDARETKGPAVGRALRVETGSGT